MIDREALIYIAGQIDSGSYIGIQELRRDKYLVVLRLRRSSPEVIELIRKVFSGGYYGMKDGKCWISYQGKQAATVLRGVYEFLTVKKGHAEIVFELRRSVENHKLVHPNAGLTQAEREFRDDCKRRIQALNGKEGESINIF